MLMTGFFMTWFSLFAAPLAGVMLVYRWRDSDAPVLRPAVGWALAFLGLIALCVATGLQWSSTAANFVCCLGGLYAYWLIAAATWAIPLRWLRILLGTLAFLPLIPSLMLGTIGLLGLIFILGDMLGPPVEARRLSHWRTCEVSTWGSAVTDSGYTVQLYWAPAWLPIVRRQLRAVSINETNPAPGRTSASCESVAAET
jgi:hypothetical protein